MGDWSLPATSRQVRAITKWCIIKDIKEPLEERVMTRTEARTLLYDLITKKK